MVRERGHAEEFLSGPNLGEVLGGLYQTEAAQDAQGGGQTGTFLILGKNLAIPWPSWAFLGCAVIQPACAPPCHSYRTDFSLREAGGISRTRHCFVTLKTYDL